MGIEELKNSFNAFQKLYVQKHGKEADADELVNYAKSQNTDIFSTWDTLFDNDANVGNSINSKSYFADGNNLLFQSDDGKVTAFNLADGTVKQATNADMAKMLDQLDDDKTNNSITTEMIANSRMKLGSDKIDFFESLNVKDKNVETNDTGNAKVTISSEDTQKLLNTMIQKTASANIHELMQKLQADPKLADQLQDTISDYIKNVFGGGNSTTALKTLTDMGQLPQSADAVNQAYQAAVKQVYNSVIKSFTDNSKTNHDIQFVLGDIHATQTDLSGIKLNLQTQVNAEEAARAAAEAAKKAANDQTVLDSMTNIELQAVWDSGNHNQALGDEIHERYAQGDRSMHDPMGFNLDGVRFDFIEDKNKDGKFDGANEFVGYDNGWNELKKYDDNGDGKISGKELEDLEVLVTDDKTGKTYTEDAAALGITNVDLKSFQQKNEVNKEGNLLAGLFDVEIKDKKIVAEQTFDKDEYLEKKYGSYYGIDMA
ncbi:MAG: hypothetical protein WCK67_05925 [bacterium]